MTRFIPPQLARALYRRTSLPFRIGFTVVAYLRSARRPRCLADRVNDRYIAGHTRDYFAEQWLYGYHRVYDLLCHFRPPRS